MDTRTGLATAGLLTMAMVLGTPGAAWADPSTFSLHVQNRSTITTDAVERAKETLAAILGEAGITVAWDGPNPLTVTLISSAMAGAMHQSPERMGFAPGGGSRFAYVVEDRVTAVCARYRVDLAALLAAAIAHEVGHLLLPAHARAPSGIMRADWNATDLSRAAVGGLIFMPSQARELRLSVR